MSVPAGKLALPELAAMKRRGEKIVMVTDLALDLELRVHPTVRDVDGLALSSRNDRLTADERLRALALPRALATRDRDEALLTLQAAGVEVDYVEVAHFDPHVLAGAVRVGSFSQLPRIHSRYQPCQAMRYVVAESAPCVANSSVMR